MTPARDPKQVFVQTTCRIMEEKSGSGNHGREIMEEKSQQRNHGRDILEDKT